MKPRSASPSDRSSACTKNQANFRTSRRCRFRFWKPHSVENNGNQTLSTQLAFFDGVATVDVLHGRLTFGGGELIYNQATLYSPPGFYVSSRVVGGQIGRAH